MRILGLDTSTITGVAVVDDYQLIHAEEVQFKKLREIERVDAFLGATVELLETYQPDFVMIEGYGFGNAHTLAILVEVGTAVRLALHAHSHKYIEVAPTQLKKYATGKGNSKKEEIMMAVLKRWGYESPTNNIADAFVLAMIGAHYHGGPPQDVTQTQCEVVAKLRESQCN